LEGLCGFVALAVVLRHLRVAFFGSGPLSTHFPSLTRWVGGPLIAVIEGLINGPFAVWMFCVI